MFRSAEMIDNQMIHTYKKMKISAEANSLPVNISSINNVGHALSALYCNHNKGGYLSNIDCVLLLELQQTDNDASKFAEHNINQGGFMLPDKAEYQMSSQYAHMCVSDDQHCHSTCVHHMIVIAIWVTFLCLP